MKKEVIITGVTGDIGKVMAKKYIKSNYKVIGTYSKNEIEAEKIKNTYTEDIELYKIDQRKGKVSEKSIDKILKKHNNIECAIINAGISRDNFVFSMNINDWREVIKVNLIFNIKFCKNILDYMKKRKEGSIILMSSVSGIYGRETQANYATSKGGIIGLSQLLFNSVESNENINIHVLAPGMIQGRMVDKVKKEKIELFKKMCSNKKLGKAEDVANVVYFLTSNNNYIANSIINIDGGFLKC